MFSYCPSPLSFRHPFFPLHLCCTADTLQKWCGDTLLTDNCIALKACWKPVVSQNCTNTIPQSLWSLKSQHLTRSHTAGLIFSYPKGSNNHKLSGHSLPEQWIKQWSLPFTVLTNTCFSLLGSFSSIRVPWKILPNVPKHDEERKWSWHTFLCTSNNSEMKRNQR